MGERIVYLTSKTITRVVAEEAYAMLIKNGLKIKVVSITAKEKYGDEIGKEVLAEKVTAGALTGYEKEWNINGEKVVLAVEKL